MDSLSLLVVSAFLLFPTASFQLSNGGVTSSFIRKSEPSVDIPFDADVFQPLPGYNAPQQVRIMQGDHEGKAVIVSWVTPSEPGPRVVFYGMAEEKIEEIQGSRVVGDHHDTEYFYQIRIGESSRQFSFKTPPAVGPDVPYTFDIIGDLGQTYNSNETLSHYLANQRGQAVLFVGDLSYADDHPNHDNRRWDTFGRIIERSIAYQPWITTAGNHEIDFAPEITSAQNSIIYVPAEKIFLNCGVPSGNMSSPDSLTWEATTAQAILPESKTTARIFETPYTYSFPVTPGRKFVRLHFYPTDYAFPNFNINFTISHSLLSVSVGSYISLDNFSALLNVQAINKHYFIKEFSVHISSK
ncbi:Purple acid phosphatase 2 [Acorus calamus]|uniref:Purple acid phosphatase n=1 Tax=Acorus calamus TaxID=4465 RepID=A0AAV9C5E7_ACOCL|nr:Purple acid phosphatase 2 [Acorus calamus]